MLIDGGKGFSPRSGRQRKAWGEAQRNPRLMFQISLQPTEWATASVIQGCRPLRGLKIISITRFLGFRCASPQALRCRPLRGLRLITAALDFLGQASKYKFHEYQVIY